MCELIWKMILVMIEYMQSGKGIYNKDEYNFKYILLEFGSLIWKMLGFLMNEDIKLLNRIFMLIYKMFVYFSQFWVILL